MTTRPAPFNVLRLPIGQGAATLPLFQRQAHFLDPDKATVGIALGEYVHLLKNPGSVPLAQIHDVAFRVAIAINEFIQDSDRGPLHDFSKTNDTREEGGAIMPASVDALAKGTAEVPVERFFRGQLRLEKVVDRLLECGC